MNYITAPGPGDRHDTFRDALEADDAANEAAIEEMMASPKLVDEFISDEGCSHSMIALISMLMAGGVPSFDSFRRDNVEAAIESVRYDFTAWASYPDESGITRVSRFIARAKDDALIEDSGENVA